jgi:hypothetical protein
MTLSYLVKAKKDPEPLPQEVKIEERPLDDVTKEEMVIVEVSQTDPNADFKAP